MDFPAWIEAAGLQLLPFLRACWLSPPFDFGILPADYTMKLDGLLV